MQKKLHGIHHITAVSSDPQETLDFYTSVLGLKLVKLTVNYDDPGTYHFYFADSIGSPGSLLTFFPIPIASRGRVGPGQVSAISFAIPVGSLQYWTDRLNNMRVDFAGPFSRFNHEVISFEDNDGLPLELVADEQTNDKVWQGVIPAEHAIRRFHSATLFVNESESTARLLEETMGLEPIDNEDGIARYRLFDGNITQYVHLQTAPQAARAQSGAGTVHHIAWRCLDKDQIEWGTRISSAGYHPTSIIDRNYFHSIYFRENQGILFEIASDEPGMSVDEDESLLGTRLVLPPWHEPRREQIERILPKIKLLERVTPIQNL